MITENVIITVIICITIIFVCFIIGYYSNKESKQQKLDDIRDVLYIFSKSYITVEENEDKFIGNVNDIRNMINTVKDIIY